LLMRSNLLGWWNRKWAAIKQEVARQIRIAKIPPYCYVYEPPVTFTPPANFKAADFPGLIAWHFVADPNKPKVISYWQDDVSFRYYQSRFALALGVSLSPQGGAVGDLHARDKAWWRPASAKDALLATAGVLGAISLIWTTLVPIGEKLWTKPIGEIGFSDPSVNVNEGESHEINLTARNATGSVPIDFVATAALVGGGTARQSVTIEPSYYQSIDPGSPKPITAKVVGPSLGSDNAAAADFTLEVSALARTLPFQRPTSLGSFKLPVRVFPRTFGWDHELTRVTESANLCHLAGRLYTGAAYSSGLDGIVTIHVPDTTVAHVNVRRPFIQGTQLPSSPPDDAGSTTVVTEFSSLPLEKNKVVKFEITIQPQSGQVPTDCWGAAANSVFFTEK
jgi:hypothetical protein